MDKAIYELGQEREDWLEACRKRKKSYLAQAEEQGNKDFIDDKGRQQSMRSLILEWAEEIQALLDKPNIWSYTITQIK